MKNLLSSENKKILVTLIASICFGVGAIVAQPTPPPGVPPGQPFPPTGQMPGQTPPPPGSGVLLPAGPATPTPPGSMPPPSQPAPPPGWGAPGCLVNPPSADWMNQGYMNVMATGYDTESVLVQIPLYVSYNFNGVNYDVTVINSWSPFTQTWNTNVDEPAYQTSYYFNGFTYNYYVNLPSGTFYFNL